MKTIRYQNGGRNGDPSKSKESSYFGVLQSLAKLILEKGEEGINALQDAMGFDEGSEAMREFNEKMDEMPTASQPISMRPDRRDMAPMQKMNPLGPNSKMFTDPMNRGLFEKIDVEATRNRPTVGDGVTPRRRRRFRR